jgi:DNA invertase Pin-like site-specific DNA recombinase
VVVYHLTRFAREQYDHWALRAHLNSPGTSLRSVTEPIDDTSTGVWSRNWFLRAVLGARRP